MRKVIFLNRLHRNVSNDMSKLAQSELSQVGSERPDYGIRQLIIVKKKLMFSEAMFINEF